MDSAKSTYDVFSNKFSQDIFLQKYSLNGQETWADLTKRVVASVCGQLLSKEDQEEISKIILERKFIPGGRYLYASGRPFHQVNNCFLFRAEDSREGWADVASKATAALMSGGGIGVDYSALRSRNAPIKRTGGFSTGPIALMHITNEAGRYVMQGGARRSAIWAGLNWAHGDISEFMKLKDYSEKLRAIKETDFNFPAPMELTNISVIYDTEFFIAYEDKKHPKHKLAKDVWAENCKQAFSTAEPGMSFNFRKDNESLRNAPVAAGTWVMTKSGYKQVGEIVDQEETLWTGKQWAPATFKKTKSATDTVKVNLSGNRDITTDPTHEFFVEKWVGKGKTRKLQEIVKVSAKDLKKNDILYSVLPSPTLKGIFSSTDYILGYTYGDGSFNKRYGNRAEVTFCTDESKQCVEPFRKHAWLVSLKEKDARGYTRLYLKSDDFLGREKSVFPKLYYPNLLPSFMAGLFDSDGSYDSIQHRIRLASKHRTFLEGAQRALEVLGIHSSITSGGISTYGKAQGWLLCISAEDVTKFSEIIPTIRIKPQAYKPYRLSKTKVVSVEAGDVQDVFCCDVKVEEHSFLAEGVIISNCCEVVSENDSDKCNLGTVWINRIADKDELRHVCKYATKFLICGGIYSDVPTEKVREVGNKNNRIGLGLGGIHEWLMLRGEDYEVTPELHSWLSVYEQESDSSAFITARTLGVAVPKGVRAIAPTGTIGILAETTTGIEPLFCKAYKRRYLKGNVWMYQYVVDGSVKRLQSLGVPLEKIKDSYELSFKQRVKFQADVQNYVDMSISSTCNLPAWGSDTNNAETLKKNSDTLLRYAKRLRGFTCYPEGARGGQPLVRVELAEALANEGVTYEEREDSCLNGVCGI